METRLTRRRRRATRGLLEAAEADRWVSLDLVRETGMPRDTLGMLLAFPPAYQPMQFQNDDGTWVGLPARVILERLQRAKAIERDGVDPVSGLTTQELGEVFAAAAVRGRRSLGLDA